jgi:hypothetical protein
LCRALESAAETEAALRDKLAVNADALAEEKAVTVDAAVRPFQLVSVPPRLPSHAVAF